MITSENKLKIKNGLLKEEKLTQFKQYFIKMKGNNNSIKISEFMTHLNKLQYQLGSEPYWHLLFSNGKTKWYYLNISLYNDIYYISQWIGVAANIEIHHNSEVKEGQYFGFGQIM